MDSLPGVLWHLTGAWARRGQPNIVLAHYDDLSADTGGEMRRLAGRLGITVPPRPGPGWSGRPRSRRCGPAPTASSGRRAS